MGTTRPGPQPAGREGIAQARGGGKAARVRVQQDRSVAVSLHPPTLSEIIG